METLQISKTNALKAYNGAKEEGKSLLTNLFGKEVFNQKITDRVKTFQDACEVIGIDWKESDYDEVFTPDEIAYRKLKIIAQALNEGWKPDWNNGSQYKWAPWFYLDKPGFRFYVASYAISGTDTTGGSRLCFHSEELAKYAAKQFLEFYEAFMA